MPLEIAPFTDPAKSAARSAPADEEPRWRIYINQLIANELSTITRYYDRVIQWLPRDADTGLLLASVDCKEKLRVEAPASPDTTGEDEKRTAILFNGTFNHHLDIQGLLTGIKPRLSRTTR